MRRLDSIEPTAPPATEPPQPAPKADGDAFDDIEMPAFLRRERKIFN